MNWFSAHWFSLKILYAFHWAYGYMLWLLCLIPLFYFLKWVFKSHRQRNLILSTESIPKKRSLLVYFRFLVPLFFTLGLFCLLLAISRPQLQLQNTESFTEGVDIAIAVDISDSMLDTDLKPNRLEAAKNIGENFIDGRTSDRIALVAFAGETAAVSPLTTDYRSLKESLANLKPSLIRTSGTAIGMALASCVNKLRDVTGKSKVAIIMSDGDNTAGEISPKTALELAKSFGVKVYTIAIGKTDATEKVDETTLKMLAEGSKGRFFRATDNSALNAIFNQIDQLEKSAYKDKRIFDMADYYYIYLYWTLFFFLIAFFLRITFLGNLLED